MANGAMKAEEEANLLSPKGIELRVNRSIQVEGAFGVLKHDYGYERMRRRGMAPSRPGRCSTPWA